MLVFVLF